MYFLRSEIDNQNFEVDQKVIDASALLKNIAELTDVTEPIQIKCSSKCLDIFIKVIENSNVKSLAYDLKKELFKKIEDENIVEIVKEMGILDSDVFFDFIADLILDRIDEMNMKEIQEYFDFEADFSENEKAHINGHLLDYILSIDTAELKFPFPDTDILTLKNKFYTPMNVLLQRIIARSDAEIAFYLSLINKTLKNENDKHPIKITCFLMDSYWDLEINCCHEDLDYLKFTIVTDKKDDEKYFEAIKARKLDVSFQTYVEYCTGGFNYLKPAFTQYLSMDFIIPGLPLEVNFRFRNEMLNYFDVQKCTIPSIIYILEK
uniref:Uncharacterized protein n=1 Tax=Panagrolaimus sp. ES5 TaxID=591445 RepID=A0AC34G197_9BILA